MLCSLRKLGNTLLPKRMDTWNVAPVSEALPSQVGFYISAESYIQWKTFTEMWSISPAIYKVHRGIILSMNLSELKRKINLLNKQKFFFSFSKSLGSFPPSRQEGNEEILQCGSLKGVHTMSNSQRKAGYFESKFIHWNMLEAFMYFHLLH